MQEFIRFIGIGILNTFFGYGLYCLFLFAGLHYAIAALFATILGVCFNFFTTGNFVFQNRNYRLFFRYILMYTVIYVISIVLLDIWEKIVHSYYFAGLINIPLMAILSFWLQKKFVFNRAGS